MNGASCPKKDQGPGAVRRRLAHHPKNQSKQPPSHLISTSPSLAPTVMASAPEAGTPSLAARTLSVIAKKTVHELMGDNLCVLGREKLASKNILAVREEVARRLKEKSAVHECIINHITGRAQSSPVSISADVDAMLSLQKCV